MSLQLGANFPIRWLAAAPETRQQFIGDLNNVCLLLDPETDFETWIKNQRVDCDQPMNMASHEHSAKISLTVDALVALEQRLIAQANQVIERALDPIRAELKGWVHAQIKQEIQAMQQERSS